MAGIDRVTCNLRHEVVQIAWLSDVISLYELGISGDVIYITYEAAGWNVL